MKLGTYTTIDCPCLDGLTVEQQNNSIENKKLTDEAYEFLLERFLRIGGLVRTVKNPHDFGTYESFEVDYPVGMEDYDEEWSSEIELDMKGEFESIASIIEKEYGERFNKYL